MFGSVGSATASDALTRLSGSVDELQTLQLSSLSDGDLLGVLRDLETHKRRLATADHQLVAEIGSRGLARERGCKDTATLLRQLLRVTPHEASGRVRAAADMGPRRGLTGEVLAPVFGRSPPPKPPAPSRPSMPRSSPAPLIRCPPPSRPNTTSP